MPNFRGNEDLHKLGKEYLDASLCKFVVYFLQHSETFWRITRLSTTNNRWVINTQTGPAFWPTLYMYTVSQKTPSTFLIITRTRIIGF